MASTTLAFDIFARDRTATRTFDRVGRSATTMSDRFRTAARTAARLGAGMGAALGTGLVFATKAAAQEEQEMAVLANTLRKTTDATDDQIASVESWITATQNATGVADGDLRPALGRLVVATGDVSRAQDLMNVALDIAAARGASLDSVVAALGKAAVGSTAGLGRLGLATKDAAGEALSFDEILQHASATMGGAAATAADTASGRFNIMRARFADLTEQVGEKLLPVLNRLLSWILDDAIPALAEFGRWFSEEVLPRLRRVATFVQETLIPNMNRLAQDVLPAVEDAASSLRTSIDDLRGAFTVSKGSSDKLRGSLELLPIAAAAIRAEFKVVTVNVRVLTTAFRILTANIKFVVEQAIRAIRLLMRLRDLAPDLPDLPSLPGWANPFDGGDSQAPTRRRPPPRPTRAPAATSSGDRELRLIRQAVTRRNRPDPLTAGWAAL